MHKKLTWITESNQMTESIPSWSFTVSQYLALLFEWNEINTVIITQQRQKYHYSFEQWRDTASECVERNFLPFFSFMVKLSLIIWQRVWLFSRLSPQAAGHCEGLICIHHTLPEERGGGEEDEEESQRADGHAWRRECDGQQDSESDAAAACIACTWCTVDYSSFQFRMRCKSLWNGNESLIVTKWQEFRPHKLKETLIRSHGF